MCVCVARAEEEAVGSTKLTNQLYVQSANFVNNNEDNHGAATIVSVVS